VLPPLLLRLLQLLIRLLIISPLLILR